MALSLVVIAGMLVMISHGAPARQQDEGTAAHLFQLWLAFEFFALLFFASKWLPRTPKDALVVLALQIALVILGCAPIWYFKL